MFRKPRRGQGADEPEPLPDGAARTPPRAPVVGLLEQLQGIVTGHPPEEALERALAAVVEQSGARAGALCLFDARNGILRLATEVGLSDEGCKQLRTVRASDPSAWDMPLHGLQNRRAYLIESAAQNRYVPTLIEGAVVTTIACIPIVQGVDALASLILVAANPRRFGEKDIQALVKPLREVANLVATIKKQAIAGGSRPAAAPASPAAAEPVAARPSAPPPIAPAAIAQPPAPAATSIAVPPPPSAREHATESVALVAERDGLLAQLEARIAERERLTLELAEAGNARARLEAALDGAKAVREALEADLARAREQADQVAVLSATLAEKAGEREALQEQTRAATAARDEALARVEEIEQARADLARRVDAAASAVERGQQELAQRVAEAESAAAAFESERRRWEVRLRDAEGAVARARDEQNAAEPERARLAVELKSAEAREHNLREELSAANVRVGTAVKAALEAAKNAEEARTRAQQEIEAAQAQVASAESEVGRALGREQELSHEVGRLAAELRGAQAREQQLRDDLATSDAKHALTGEADLHAAIETARAADAAHASAVAELEAARMQVAAAEEKVARTIAREQEQERELARMSSELRGSAAREARLRDELQAARSERMESDDSALAAALESARTADAARVGLEAELEAARAQVGTLRGTMSTLEAEVARMNDQLSRMAASERSASGERTRLEATLGQAQAQEQSLRDRVAQLEQELVTLREQRERTRASERDREGEASGIQARLDAIEADRDHIRSALTAAEADRDHLRTELASATATQARLEQALASESEQRALLDAALNQAKLSRTELEHSQARSQAEIARLVSEREELLAARGEAGPGAGGVTAGLVPWGEPDDGAASAAGRAPVLQVIPTPSQPRGRAKDGDGKRTVVVIDTETTWEGAANDGCAVTVVAPDSDVAGRLAALAPERVLVNLTAPEVLNVLATVRAAGYRGHFWGCVANPALDRGLPLGMIEPGAHPVDADVILSALADFVAKGSRVITAGADVDGLMSLRQALSRQGVSVSMAWDAKQVSDLLPVVRPHAVVIDLDLPRKDGFGVVAGLAHLSPIPHAVLVGGVADAAATFALALNDSRHGTKVGPLERLISSCLARSERPPVDVDLRTRNSAPRVAAALSKQALSGK
jgi:hypothetical protein